MPANGFPASDSQKKFGFNSTTWIFVVASFILAVILFVFPVSHSRHMYFLLDNAEKSAKPILLTFPLLGLLAGCLYSRIWRIVVCALISVMACSFAFLVEGTSNVQPSWGVIFLAAAIIALMWLAAASPAKLESFPSPLRDAEAKLRWAYAGLAVFGTLLFCFCTVTVYGTAAYGKVSGSRWLDLAMFSPAKDGWYVIILPILAAAASVCVFLRKKWLDCVLSLLMYVPVLLLAGNVDKGIKMDAGFYLYILCVTAMLGLTLWQMSKQAQSTLSSPTGKE